MTNVRRTARVTALTMAALALTAGVAGATSTVSNGKGTKPSVSGVVASVNGVSTPGTCGTSDSGVFIIDTNSSSNPPVVEVTTVTVTPTTTYAENGVATPTFANVCVGDKTTVIGDNVANAMTADAVAIRVPKSVHVFGSVTAINGVTTDGTCGTTGASGNFDLVTIVGSVATDSIVYVSGQTDFTEQNTPGASFADVCVGTLAEAMGPSADGAIVATTVKIRVPKAVTIRGVVSAVNGDSTADACGTAGSAGNFTVLSANGNGVSHYFQIAVTTSTTFAEANVSDATFGNVCVGGRAVSIGIPSSGTLTADAVAYYPPKVPKA
jgi:hypothetical protein